MTCMGIRAVGWHWIGEEYFRAKICLRKTLRQCNCLWTYDLNMIHCSIGAYQLSFTQCLEPWPSVPCWLWLEAWPRGTQHFSCCFSDACSTISVVYPGSSPNPTFNVSPALETSPSSQTKWNGCRCGSRVHHIIWIQTLTLISTSACSLLQWLLVTPDFKGVTDSLTMSFPFWCCFPQIPVLSWPISVFWTFQSRAACTSSRRKWSQRAPYPFPILCSSASTESSHDPNLSVLPDLT